MKVVKVTVVNDENEELVLDVIDGSMLLVCKGDTEDNPKILTQTTTNAAVNLELIKKILG